MANAKKTAPSKNLPHVGTCFKCLGRGSFDGFAHVVGGRCFQCEGECVIVYGAKRWDWARASRADFIEFIRQGLAAFGWMAADDMVNIKRAKRVLSNHVSRVSAAAARAGHLDIFDRAQKALDAHSGRDFAKVAALRAKIEGELVAAKAQAVAAA